MAKPVGRSKGVSGSTEERVRESSALLVVWGLDDEVRGSRAVAGELAVEKKNEENEQS